MMCISMIVSNRVSNPSFIFSNNEKLFKENHLYCMLEVTVYIINHMDNNLLKNYEMEREREGGEARLLLTITVTKERYWS